MGTNMMINIKIIVILSGEPKIRIGTINKPGNMAIILPQLNIPAERRALVAGMVIV